MDKQKVREFWNPLLNAYFPAGSHSMKFMKVHVTRVTMCNDFHGSKEVLLQHAPADNLQVEIVKKPALLKVG
jgi:general stress protein 26